MDPTQKARYIIENNNFMVLSTADSTGKPWVSPVGFVYDDNYNLYWVSYKEAIHSKNIEQRPEVAIVIFGQVAGAMDGVYVDAKAEVVEDADHLQTIIDLFKERRPQPTRFVTESLSDITGDAVWRMYQAKPLHVWKRADSVVNGQAITVREPISL
jgi:nitroimidazol reductase NimA-like FMN-containing flavoprotein (pyridoxamine 5'-phosphate oxidase superfamily)